MKETDKKERPNCDKCAHRRTIPGDAHTRCNNHGAHVKGHLQGIQGGWFMWPRNFDPTWLLECDGFSTEEEDRKAETKEVDPLLELFATMGR